MQRSNAACAEGALEFLAGRIDYERGVTVPYDQRAFHLDRMRELLARLGNPHQRLAIVHVAGTKGKGSTAAMIASMLSAAGLRAGLYSSPHLDCVEERLMIDGRVCPRDELVALVERVRSVIAAMDAEPPSELGRSMSPTYFEIVTALALLRFADERVDAAVLEVGLGGRLDSTNVCTPLVSVITNISFDHTELLGHTLAAIAGEKAGIIKHSRPVVSGVLQPEAQCVVASAARAQHSRLVQLGDDFDFSYRPPHHLEAAPAFGQMDFDWRAGESKRSLRDLTLGLLGEHQAANAAVALATLEELARQGLNVGETAIRRGLAEVRWPARVEVLARRPTVVLDAAHNVASIEALVRVLDASFAPGPRLLVFATSRDKDARGMLEVLLPKFDTAIFTRYQTNPRGMPADELMRLAGGHPRTKCHLAADPAAAWQLANQLASPEHLICIAGSFFTAAEMRAVIGASSG